MKIYFIQDGSLFFWVVAEQNGIMKILDSFYTEDVCSSDLVGLLKSFCILTEGEEPKFFKLDVYEIIRRYFQENLHLFIDNYALKKDEAHEIEEVGETAVLVHLLTIHPDLLLAAEKYRH
jgi:hypothetical protein